MRRIVSTQQHAAGAAVQLDSYFDRVIKYIPSDIVGAWVAISGLVAGAVKVPTAIILWIMFIVMAVITAIWTLKQTSIPGQPPAITQVCISTGSFIVWVFALGGPFTNLSWYQPLYGSLVLIVYTLIVAMVVPKE